MLKPNDPVEPLKRAVAQTTRSLAENPDLDVTYGTDPASLRGDKIRLPLPPRDLDPKEVARLRGEADSLALRISHHDPKTDARFQPKGTSARAVFNALEQARIDAIGTCAMKGVADNISAAIEYRCDKKGLGRMEDRQDGPLAEIAALILREHLTGLAPPDSAQDLVEAMRPHIEQQGKDSLQNMVEAMDSQSAFARAARQFLADLNLADDLLDEENEHANDDDGDDDSADPDPNETDNAAQQSEGVSEQDVEFSDDPQPDGDEQSVEIDAADLIDAQEGDDTAHGEKPWRPNQDGPLRPNEPIYQVFSSQDDEVIPATELCDPEELSRLRHYLDQQLTPLQNIVAPPGQSPAAFADGATKPRLGF